jgi:hypothetical protein
MVRLFRSLPFHTDSQVLGKQFFAVWNFSGGELPGCVLGAIKSGIHRSDRLGAEEANEAALWRELLTESGILKPEMTEGLLQA